MGTVGTVKYQKGGKTINIPDTPQQRKAFERKGYAQRTTTKTPSRSSGRVSAPVTKTISLVMKSKDGKYESFQNIPSKNLEGLKRAGYTAVKTVEGRSIQQSEVNKAISGDKGTIKLTSGSTLHYSKSEYKGKTAKQIVEKINIERQKKAKVTKAKTIEDIKTKKELQRVIGTVGRRTVEEAKRSLVKSISRKQYKEIKAGKQKVWRDPEGKTFITKTATVLGMKPEVARQRGFTEVKPKEIVEKEGKLFVEPKAKIGAITPEEVTKGIIGAGKIGEIGITKLPEEEYKGYEILQEKEKKITPFIEKLTYKRSPEYAIKVGEMAFAEMRKKGTVEQFKGLVASGMRPWSMEIAGMQIAESIGQVKKGTTQRLLTKRLGEDIIQTGREGLSITGYIKRLAEAPASVIGAPLTMIGMGSAFTGVRGALAGQSVRMKNIFDITMAGVGAWWIGSRAGEMSAVEFKHEQKDRPRLFSLALQTSAEIGGLFLGGGFVSAKVHGKSATLKTKPRGITKRDIRTTVKKDVKGRTTEIKKEGNIDINVEIPDGKIVKVKGHFKAIKKNGLYRGYVKVPRQTVEGVKVNPQKMVLRDIDPYYKDPMRDLPKGEVIIPKPKKPVKFERAMKPEKPEPFTNIDNLYKKTVSKVNEQSKQLEPIIPRELAKPKLKTKPETRLAKIKRLKKQEIMRRQRTPVQEILNRPVSIWKPPMLPIRRPITPIIRVNKDYLEVQKGMTDVMKRLEPYKKPKPPEKLKPTKPKKPKPPEKTGMGLPLFPFIGAPFGVGLGYNIDDQYYTITKHLKHKVPTIEELLKM